MTQGLSNLAAKLLNRGPRFALGGVPVCVLCGATAEGMGLCGGCEAALPRLPPERCPTCAMPSARGLTCGRCLVHPPALERVEAAVAYAFPIDGLVQTLKYRHHLAVATVLGHLLAVAVKDACRPELVFAVPLGEQRLRERGFNQSLEIARVAGRILGLPVEAHAIRRVRDTPPQTALPFKERAKNVRRAFVCDVDLAGKRVAIVDDVLTTGASLDACARALRKAGAAAVTGWVAARTLLDD